MSAERLSNLPHLVRTTRNRAQPEVALYSLVGNIHILNPRSLGVGATHLLAIAGDIAHIPQVGIVISKSADRSGCRIGALLLVSCC